MRNGRIVVYFREDVERWLVARVVDPAERA
jgi:hypothetical protein